MDLNKELSRILEITDRIHFCIFSTSFLISTHVDKKGGDRIYIQVSYLEECKNTGKTEEWFGRKWYLSEHMLDDEIVKTCYAACKAAVEHEVMESFKVDEITLFNPHINFEELLKISNKEVKR
jgi:hypothetical protein